MLIAGKARGVARCGMMNETRAAQDGAQARGRARGGLRVRRWPWQMLLAGLVALIAVEGQPVAASHATTGPTGRMAESARQQAAAPAQTEASASATTDSRPDFRVAFTSLDDA